jgi:formylglycine-generating enzyme required for sulfatase activity
VPSTRVYVRITDQAPLGPVSGNVLVESADVTSRTVSLTGTVVESPVVLVPAGTLPPNIAVASFFIGKREVTVAEWNEVRALASTRGYSDLPVATGSATDPARNVSWYDSVKWLNAKSELEGLDPVYWQVDTQGVAQVYRNNVFQNWVPEIRSANNGYRLPGQNEWEWAARGGPAGLANNFVYSGSNTIGDVAWYTLNSGGIVRAVGTRTGNQLGIFDMSGNVNEWCQDPVNFAQARFRGGAFDSVAKQCEVTFLSFGELSTLADPRTRSPNIGLRYARTPGTGSQVISFTITVNGTPVRVERYGTGSRGIIFFSYWSGGQAATELPAVLRTTPGFPFTQDLDGGNYSMFLWSYPQNTPPFPTQVNSALSVWQGGSYSTRLSLTGIAKSVADQIRANSPDLIEVCLVGNSLGAGIVLQGYNSLIRDALVPVRFVLVAPTEVFLPPLATLPPLLQRTVIASDPVNDTFFRTPADIAYISANSSPLNWPPGYVPGVSDAHWIIPFGAPMPYVFDLVDEVFSLNP